MNVQSNQPGKPGSRGNVGAAAADSSVIREIALRRARMAWLLTAILLVVYFGYLSLSAFAKQFMFIQLTEGMTVAMIVALIAIFVPWFLALIYLNWANRYHDVACDRIDEGRTV